VLYHLRGQRVLQVSHVTQVIHVFVLLTVIAESLVTFVISVRHDPSARRATSLSFAHGTFLFSAVFVVRETYVTSQMPVAFGTWEFERWRTRTEGLPCNRYTSGRRLRDVSSKCFVAHFKHVPSSHGTIMFIIT